jgi:hypothetical protein
MNLQRALTTVFLLSLFAAPAAFSAEDQQAVEKAEAAQEDADDEKNSELLQKLYEGKFMISDANGENAEVVGVFVSGGQTYQLKVESPDLLKELKSLQGQPVTLNGKVRNKGKYFVAVGVMRQGAAPLFSRRRGGI